MDFAIHPLLFFNTDKAFCWCLNHHNFANSSKASLFSLIIISLSASIYFLVSSQNYMNFLLIILWKPLILPCFRLFLLNYTIKKIRARILNKNNKPTSLVKKITPKVDFTGTIYIITFKSKTEWSDFLWEM